MTDRDELGIRILKHLGYTAHQIDCNGATGRWTLRDAEGYNERWCVETENLAWRFEAYATVSVQHTLARFPRHVKVTVEYQNAHCRVSIDDEYYNELYPDNELDIAITEAWFNWFLKQEALEDRA